MEKLLCVRKLRIRRLFVMFAMLLSGSVLFTLYILTLTCCARVVDPDLSPPDRPSKVILIRDGEEDESRYQQVLEKLEDSANPPHFRRKPLLDRDGEVISEQHHHRAHSRHRHSDTSVDKDESNPVVLRYDDEDSDGELIYPDYDSEPSRPKKRDRTRQSKGGIKPHQKASRKLPQAIIIGVKKGGTRALLEFLRIHPDVRAPGPEPHFFDRNYDKGIDWYRHQMPPTFDDQLTIEKTPSYFVTKGVPGRIFNMSKNIKFIVVVRDPVTRAVSDYTQALAKRNNISSFEAMAFEDNSTGLVDTSWGAIRIGVYAKHLERWLQYFPLSQMHFVSGEKLITDPAGEIGKVQDFLGLQRIITRKNFFFNSTKGFPCLVRPDGNPRKPHCLGKTKGREHPKIDPKVLQRLRDFFRPFNQKFYQMAGQDFGWS